MENKPLSPEEVQADSLVLVSGQWDVFIVCNRRLGRVDYVDSKKGQVGLEVLGVGNRLSMSFESIREARLYKLETPTEKEVERVFEENTQHWNSELQKAQERVSIVRNELVRIEHWRRNYR